VGAPASEGAKSMAAADQRAKTAYPGSPGPCQAR
jgi:hypothetical protein